MHSFAAALHGMRPPRANAPAALGPAAIALGLLLAPQWALACASCRPAVLRAVLDDAFWPTLGGLLAVPLLTVALVLALTRERRSKI